LESRDCRKEEAMRKKKNEGSLFAHTHTHTHTKTQLVQLINK